VLAALTIDAAYELAAPHCLDGPEQRPRSPKSRESLEAGHVALSTGATQARTQPGG